MKRFASAPRPLSPTDRKKIFGWLRRVKEHVRSTHRGNHHDHLVRGDGDLAEAIVDYSSVAYFGWTRPGEETLAVILNEGDRNIRKRVARLRRARLLIVIPPSNGWRSNRYIPVLDGHPLFEVALGAEQVRAAIAALHRDDFDSETPAPPQDTSASGTPIPPEKANTVHAGRNARSAEPSSNNLQEGDFPTPYPAPKTEPTAPLGEEDKHGLEILEATFAAPPEPSSTAYGTSDRPKKLTLPDGCPTGQEPRPRAQSAETERGTAPVVEFNFACLVRDYPHPPSSHGAERPAYYPHARSVWAKLTIQQKQCAVRAAASAPGKEWLGHWLDRGRETGNFEIVEQPPEARRVWVSKGTPQWFAWIDYYRAEGRRPLTAQHRVDGKMQTGWMFDTEWPPGAENGVCVGGAQ